MPVMTERSSTARPPLSSALALGIALLAATGCGDDDPDGSPTGSGASAGSGQGGASSGGTGSGAEAGGGMGGNGGAGGQGPCATDADCLPHQACDAATAPPSCVCDLPLDGVRGCPPTRVSMGRGGCAVRADDTLVCWGSNAHGQVGDGTTDARFAPVPLAGSEWARVSAGENVTAAVDTAGALWIWGGKLRSAEPKPVLGADWSAISSGGGHGCGIESGGGLWCWGDGSYGQLGDNSFNDSSDPTPVGNASWRAVSAGGMHTCGIQNDGSLWCWGANKRGQLGLGVADDTWYTQPFQVDPAGEPWASVSAGGEWNRSNGHTCGIRENGTLWCWGDNVDGTDGPEGDVSMKTLPVQIGADADWAAVTAGGAFTLATKADGSVWGFGTGGHGWLGDGLEAPAALPVEIPALAGATRVDAGATNGIVLHADESVEAWGVGAELGAGPGWGRQLAPTQVAAATSWDSVDAGGGTCATTAAGALWCWGENTIGEVGNGQQWWNEETPQQVGASTSWAATCSGSDHSCGVHDDGSLWCWGDGKHGAIGTGGDGPSNVPLQVGTDSDWSDVSCGVGHTCALRSDATLWCWGANYMGQVGDGPSFNGPIWEPFESEPGTSWSAVSASDGHTCGIRTDGSLWCWGSNNIGQLGNGTTDASSAMEQVASPWTWTAVSANRYTTCAVRSDGTLWCWGYGPGPSPQQIGGTTSWASVSRGYEHTCGLQLDDTIWCFGDNTSGQLGDGTTTASAVPKQVGSLAGWRSIRAGDHHTCATRHDDTLWCWGDNAAGQLGDDQAWAELPVPVALP
jgi:alpha-tubulin suppressor-like RCC1 family protein